MAVVIRNLNELPTSCNKCRFAKELPQQDGTVDVRCIITGDYVFCTNIRDYLCPLVEIHDDTLKILFDIQKIIDENHNKELSNEN